MTGVTAKSKGKSTEDDEKELARLQNKDFWLQISRAKLMMDLIFVCECQSRRRFGENLTKGITGYEVFYIRRARDSVKAFTGLSSAILRYVVIRRGDQGQEADPCDGRQHC
jgi:hypothetical protein